MDVNLELYKCFYYVATTLSFSEASRQLFISQSAVSQGIKALEKTGAGTVLPKYQKSISLLGRRSTFPARKASFGNDFPGEKRSCLQKMSFRDS